jgi:hypothetical protein
VGKNGILVFIPRWKWCSYGCVAGKMGMMIIIGMKILILKIQTIILSIGVGIYEYYKSGNKPY